MLETLGQADFGLYGLGRNHGIHEKVLSELENSWSLELENGIGDCWVRGVVRINGINRIGGW